MGLWFVKIVLIFGLQISCIFASELARTRCTLYNGRCTYRVQLFDGCQGNGADDVISEDVTSSQEVENAVPAQGVDFERKLRDVEAHLNKKIADLKRTVDDLNSLALPRDDADSYWEKFDPYGRPSDHIEERLDTRGFSMQTRPEDGLLRRVHDEFSLIRQELEQTRVDLEEKERVLAEATAENQRSRVVCDVTTADVEELKSQLANKDDEMRLWREELERTQRQLREKMDQLESATLRLAQVENERANLQTYVEEKIAENEELKNAVRDCERALRNQNLDTFEQHTEVIQDLQRQIAEGKEKVKSVESARDGFYDELCEVRDELEVLTATNAVNLKALQDCHEST